LSKNGGSFPTVRSSSLCETSQVRIEERLSAALRKVALVSQRSGEHHRTESRLNRQPMPDHGWKGPFEDPIPLPRGRQLVTPQDATGYIIKLPKSEQDLREWQAATEALIGGGRSRAAYACPRGHAESAESARRACVQPRPERPASGKAEADRAAFVRMKGGDNPDIITRDRGDLVHFAGV
jgi:hypothetical protein